MDPGVIGVFIPIVAIVGGIAVAIASIIAKAKTRQLEIQERIAMIEKGLVPAPEVDPRGFDSAMDRVTSHHRSSWSGRHRRGGIILIGVGLGLMVLIGFAGQEPGSAIGVGGFLVIIGVAFLINSLFETPSTSEPSGSSDRQDPPAASSSQSPL